MSADMDPSAVFSNTTTYGSTSLKLFYHPLSPFSRKVYMYAIELGLEELVDLRQVVVAPTHYKGWSDNVPDVAVFNPLAKIPVLAVGSGDGIFDSGVICEFLSNIAVKRSEAEMGTALDVVKDMTYWRLRAMEHCAGGMLDAEILVVYEQKIRQEKGILFQEWVDGQREKVTRGFDRLEAEAKRGTLTLLKPSQKAEIPEVAVAAALGFFDIRKIEWRQGRNCLDKWFDEFSKRKSFTVTRPNLDWKSGKAVEESFKL